MNTKTGVDGFQQAIFDLVKEYGTEVENVLEKSIDETVKFAKNELKTVGDYDDRTGKYRKSWVSETEVTSSGDGKHFVARIGNKQPLPLEYGHVKQNGGRTRAFPHMEIVAQSAEQELLKILERNLK